MPTDRQIAPEPTRLADSLLELRRVLEQVAHCGTQSRGVTLQLVP